MVGRKYTVPTDAREFTPMKNVAIPTKSFTIASSVVWSVEKPKYVMSCCWFVSEFGTLSNAEKSAKSILIGTCLGSLEYYRGALVREYIISW